MSPPPGAAPPDAPSASSAGRAKSAARATIESRLGELVSLSHDLHAHPELAFEESRSSALVAAELAAGGFAVDAGVCDLPTAFVASAGRGPLQVAICAEYDALPGMGHACGHNIIAAAAVGAGLALAPLADDLGLTVKVVGTPAEEGGGGKILLLERGAFAGTHAALMVHPGPAEERVMRSLAVSHFEVRYTGKAAHAAGYPEDGINAADALTVAQVGIGLLRQHLRPHDRVHGIVTHGGDSANVVPAHTSAQYMVRSATLATLAQVEAKVRHCFEAGALATGCRLEIERQSPNYAELEPDGELTAAYVANAQDLGRVFPDQPEGSFVASTDMGNVSLAIPSIHPMLGISSLPAVNHQPEFAAACVTPAADRSVGDGAVAMAWTVVDAATDPALRARLLSRPA